jgi:DNA-binding MarR family transcriptional regulator
MIDILNLNMRQVGVLLNLSHVEAGQPFKTMASLAKKVRCSSAAMTGIKDKLVVAGLLKEMGDPNDRRRTLIVLTDDGKELVKRLKEYFSLFDPRDGSIVQYSYERQTHAHPAVETVVRHSPNLG